MARRDPCPGSALCPLCGFNVSLPVTVRLAVNKPLNQIGPGFLINFTIKGNYPKSWLFAVCLEQSKIKIQNHIEFQRGEGRPSPHANALFITYLC